MAEKTNANIGFEKQLWDAACVLWGHIVGVGSSRPYFVGNNGPFFAGKLGANQ